MTKFCRFARVALMQDGYIMPKFSRGRFVKYDHERSHSHTALVCWKKRIGAKNRFMKSWVAPQDLVPA